MKVHFDISSLKGTTATEYGMRFLFGGLVAVVAGAVASKYGPVVGGLFLAFPAIFPASATLIEKHEQEKQSRDGIDRKEGAISGAKAAAVDAVGTAIGGIGLMAFGLVVWLTAAHLPAPAVLGLAFVTWAIVSVTGWVIRQRL